MKRKLEQFPGQLTLFDIDQDNRKAPAKRLQTCSSASPRLHPGKREVRVIDYVDHQVPMLAKMFHKRQIGYRSIGYQEEEIGPLL